jgi:hypothetical protein
MNKTLQRFLLAFFAGAFLLIAGWCSYQIYTLSSQRAEIKKDYSELNSITYGLLSVNVWRDYLTEIVINRINDFELSEAQEDTLKYEVGQMLNAVIDRADSMVDQKQTTIKGKLKKFAVRTLVNEEKVRALVPGFSKTIVDEIQKEENKDALKYIVRSKIQEYSDITHANTEDLILLENILEKHHAADVEEFNQQAAVSLQALQEKIYFYTFVVLGIVLLFLVFWWILRNQKVLHSPFFVFSVLLSLLVLWAGLTAPMIEIDARFQEVDFFLIGEEISFRDQVIFFQSKSIVDVVGILLESGSLDSILVGMLILLFSIVFPVAKLLSTQLYLAANERWRRNRLIYFFAFKSGKWSMADVYVIAVFMAYIGFKGILDNQLSVLNVESESLVSISTSLTSLQPGFILFIGFVLFSLLLSVILRKITYQDKLKAV